MFGFAVGYLVARNKNSTQTIPVWQEIRNFYQEPLNGVTLLFAPLTENRFTALIILKGRWGWFSNLPAPIVRVDLRLPAAWRTAQYSWLLDAQKSGKQTLFG